MHRLKADLVVVGGGSSGCALAGRLAGAGRDVLLIEAGPDYGPLRAGGWPAELVDARRIATSHDWHYQAGRWRFERARVIGGCSAHNGAIAAVGHRSDYESWGLPGWSGTQVAALFERVIQTMRVRTYRTDEAGPFHARCLRAAAEMGWHIAQDLCDLDANDSFGLESVNIVDGMRWNTAFAYLDPVREAGHLQILDETLVDRIVSEGAGGSLHGMRRGESIRIDYNTVVLSAGVYGTPAILQRSGIGDPDHLRALGIDVITPLPGVGRNLHDHPMVHVDREVGPELQGWLNDAQARGFLPEEQTLGKALSGQARDGLFDLHLYPVCASNQTSQLHGRVLIEVACMTPRSRGSVRIVSPDPQTPPDIDHGYLSDPGHHDIAVLRDGVAMAQKLFQQPLLAELLGGPLVDVSSDQAIRDTVVHYYHPVGTCAMGANASARAGMAVCDPDGLVIGVPGIVVADASLMPQIPRANTNLPAIMIAERIAQTLL
jgi:choline dehydrogenase